MPLTLEEIFDSKRFEEKSLKQPKWLKDGRLGFIDDWPGTDKPTVWTYDPGANRKDPLFDPATLLLSGAEKPIEVKGVVWSDDGRQLIITSEAPARFKPCGDLYLYDAETRQLSQLTATAEAQYHPKFGPDGRTVGVVRSNDLYLIDLESGQDRRVTHGGSETLYNGRCGWVYEEELGLADGWGWSPDDKTIAYLQQDESSVPVTLLPSYDQPNAEPEVTRYPKAGDANPITRLGLLNVETGETRWVDLPGREEDGYIAGFQWTPSGRFVVVQVLNRAQDNIAVLAIEAETDHPSCYVTERDATWVSHSSPLRVSLTDDRILWPLNEGAFRHIWSFGPYGSGSRVTHGSWDVDEIIGCAGTEVFFSACLPTPSERRVYHTDPLRGGQISLVDDKPGWHRATLSEDGKYLLHTHSSVSEPPRTVVRKTNGDFVATLCEQKEDFLEGVGLLPWEWLQVEASGEKLNARMLKPANLEPGRRCPAIVFTYGGPGSQVVTNQWGGKQGLWHQFMAQQGYVIFMLDNRGTGGRGRDFMKQVYLKLGQLETLDQVAGAEYLRTLPFVDPDRIGIWGWSYGGYMATMCMLHGADVFKAGIAVAPVVDWALYDSIYTERYMRTPQENPEGYRTGSPVFDAEKLRGKFLLIHGLADDNVHFQNSVRLATALQDAKQPFETMFYPAKRHGIEDRHYHLYSTMTDFWLRSL